MVGSSPNICIHWNLKAWMQNNIYRISHNERRKTVRNPLGPYSNLEKFVNEFWCFNILFHLSVAIFLKVKKP